MGNEKSMTATVYVINNGRVLLHRHKKFNLLFPVGGHIEKGELPQEAAIREVKEEAGLKIQIWTKEQELNLTKVKQLINPQYMLLENIGKEIENIDFIYFGVTTNLICKPQKGESREFYWLTQEEIEVDKNIKEHVKVIAIEALKCISENN